MSPDLLAFLETNRYLNPKDITGERVACIMPLMFTAAIITGHKNTMRDMYDERYCYHSIAEAVAALEKWDGNGDPDGWHRHIPSGRRRTNGDPLLEYLRQ